MNVVRFPPLPEVPAPPRSEPDARQERSQYTLAALSEMLGMEAADADDGPVGFRASAVDVGALQEMLERAIAVFDMRQLRDRWAEDVREWMQSAVLAWVQRCKLIDMSLESNGVHVQLQTQDDRGYYAYEFDVFPGRG